MVRCLTLADALAAKGAQVSFVCRGDLATGIAMVAASGFDVHRISPGTADTHDDAWRMDAEHTLQALRAATVPVDWLIVDRYTLGRDWETAVGSAVGRMLVIDDLGNREHTCDLLLDQNLVADMLHRYDRKLQRGHALLGPRFALLQKPYREWREQVSVRSGAVRRIIVFFGGGDVERLTAATLAELGTLRMDDVHFDVVLGRGKFADTRLRRAALPPQVAFHSDLPSLAPLMASADLAIGAGGATSWERLCLGLPSIVVTLASNQVPIAEELARRGLVRWVGDREHIDPGRVAAEVASVVREGLDPAWSESCLAAVDGRGVERVCRAMQLADKLPLSARRAGASDEALILAWANDELVRQNALNPAPISADTHRSWFRQRISGNSAGALYVIESCDGLPLGQVRIEPDAGAWEIHYSVAKAFRGHGLGVQLLDAAIAQHQREFGDVVLFGRVRAENAASRRIFHKLGFKEEPGRSGTVVFRREPGQTGHARAGGV